MRGEIRQRLLICLLAVGFATATPAQDHQGEVESWNFDVYLDDKKVGKHRFQVAETNGHKHVQSDASFKYKLLFLTAFRYEHKAAEQWTDNCLIELNSSTDTNGERIIVSGLRTGNEFVIERDDKPSVLPDCVMTFAYWNADFLNQSRLLNPQTGEYVDVRIENMGNETREVRGQQVAATRFRLTAPDVDLMLWYSPTNKWLGLESIAKGGRIIRYVLS